VAVLTTTFRDPAEHRRAFRIIGAIRAKRGAVGCLLGGVLTQSLP
jgi:hypothetical protein